MTIAAFRVYADTSVFGGVFDEEFAEPSRRFFDDVRRGRLTLATSAIVRREADDAPPEVSNLFREMLRFASVAEVDERVVRLHHAYLTAGILPPASSDDALHVALATVSGCAPIVSWNFRHIVHLRKVPMYNGVNEINGYRPIAICSPREVITYEDENV